MIEREDDGRVIKARVMRRWAWEMMLQMYARIEEFNEEENFKEYTLEQNAELAERVGIINMTLLSAVLAYMDPMAQETGMPDMPAGGEMVM